MLKERVLLHCIIYMYNYLIYYERITRPNKPIDSFPSYNISLTSGISEFHTTHNISMNILWKKRNFSYHFYSTLLWILKLMLLLRWREVEKIDNKIIVFHSLVLLLLPLLLRMLNQPKNVFSIKLFFWDFTFDRERERRSHFYEYNRN